VQDASDLQSEYIRSIVTKPHRATDQTQIELSVGDIVYVLEQDETGWWGGFKEGEDQTGWFPGSCVRPVLPTEEPKEHAEACKGSAAETEGAHQRDSRPVASPMRGEHRVATTEAAKDAGTVQLAGPDQQQQQPQQQPHPAATVHSPGAIDSQAATEALHDNEKLRKENEELANRMKTLKRQSDTDRHTLQRLEAEREQERQQVEQMEALAKQERAQREHLEHALADQRAMLEREQEAFRQEQLRLAAQASSLQESWSRPSDVLPRWAVWSRCRQTSPWSASRTASASPAAWTTASRT